MPETDQKLADLTPVTGTKPRPRVFRRFLRDWLVPEWRWISVGILFSAVTAIAAFGYAEITTRAVNWLRDLDHRVFTLAPLIMIGLVLVRSVAMYIQTQAFNLGVQKAMVNMQDALFGSLIEGDFARLQGEKSGEYVSRFANDMTLIREASLRVATNIARSTFTIIACLVFMLIQDWALALLLLVVYPIAFWPVVRLGERIRKTSKRAQEQVGELTANLGEAFQGARTVKAFRLEDYQRARAKAGFAERARLYMKILRSKAMVDPFLEVVGGIALAGLFAFAGWRAMNGQSSVGELIGFITAIGVASPEIRALGTLNAVVNEGMAAADRLYSAMDAKADVTDAPNAVELHESQGHIEFKQVTFAYPGGDPVLKGLDLDITPGQTIALVGPSGAGKSTVFNLLMRLYDVTGGAIHLDATDIRKVTTQSLRKQLALVSQDAFLFDASIRENITVGRPDATPAEVERALTDAACDFAFTLPGGLDAPAGEGGRNLSGGQRQRIALARALLSKAPILLLDEATSALDSDSEAQVQQAIAALSGKKTILIIAHRLATVRKADRIFVIEDGKTVETGHHAELMASSGTYARLATLQLT